MYRIFTGDKAHSSWSLRGWLMLAAFDLRFEDVPVRMYDPAFDALKAACTPARTVPIPEWDEDGRTRRVWDLLAIAETLYERHPDAGIWPADPGLRALARVLAAEMHYSFAALRDACPMNIHRTPSPLWKPPEGVAADVARIGELWSWALPARVDPGQDLPACIKRPKLALQLPELHHRQPIHIGAQAPEPHPVHLDPPRKIMFTKCPHKLARRSTRKAGKTKSQ